MSKPSKPAELYACLYAKEFPAQALLRLRPALREKPCAVIEGDPPLQQVCSLNARARELGVVPGMSRAELDSFPCAIVLPRSRKEENATKRALLECLGAFSPRVEDQSKDDAFLCVIDIVGTEKLFGAPEDLTKDLLARIKSLGVIARVAISRNVHAASALVQGLSSRTALKVIPTGEERATLAPLPLSVLELTEEQKETFSLWGIHTLGMLADLPEKELIARMGQSGKRLLQMARGELPHSFQPGEPAFVLEEQMELDSPVELLEALLFVMNVMLNQLIVRARSRLLALASISITLALEGAAAHTCTVRPALPTDDKQLWIKLIHLELESHPPQAAIFAITITAEPGSISKVQLGLFSPQLPRPGRLDVTLARIRTIVGEGNVGRPVLTDTHQPQGFRMEPFALHSNSTSVTSFKQLRSAVRKLRPAENISVNMQDNRPESFIFREVRYMVKEAYGPWVKNGEWWNPSLWSLEQWDLVAHAQEGPQFCCCVMHDRLQSNWQMAALYD